MTVEAVLAILVGGLALIALLWWLLITTEGVYLGPRVVVWLYDVYARRYDRIKQFDPVWEEETLAKPILRALRYVATPLVLDVATGTGRLPLALIEQPAFHGHIVGLDYSQKMLAVAAEKLCAAGVDLIYQSADRLPLPDETVDAITCLEALEFTPNPDTVIAEMIRVLRPGGFLLVSNRIGVQGRMMPGKTRSSVETGVLLRDRFELVDVAITRWLANYDLIRGFKSGARVRTRLTTLESALMCPRCQKAGVSRGDRMLICVHCGERIPLSAEGIILYSSRLPAVTAR
ncbi:MAG TPA: methyltransferase domain-containing protein [Aggregatilineales bacterium]|nr:methyltransferase domain-containing protein [Aggregatilineales bacterium]